MSCFRSVSPICSVNTLKQGNIRCPIHRGMHWRRWGQREPPAIQAIFWSWETAQIWSLHLPLFSPRPSPTSFPFKPFFFSLRLTNVACQILFGSYTVIQIITWHFGCIYRGAAAFMQRLKSNSRQLWPWARTWPQCTQLLVTSPPTLSFGLVSCVRIKWHNNGARPRVSGKKRLQQKSSGWKKKKRKSFYLVVYLVQTWD